MRDRVLFVMVGMTCAVAIGCVSAKQLYPGSARPAEEVGVVKMVVNGAITSISGRELEGSAYVLLPSTYRVEFRVVVMGVSFLTRSRARISGSLFPARSVLTCKPGGNITYRELRRSKLSRQGEVRKQQTVESIRITQRISSLMKSVPIEELWNRSGRTASGHGSK